MDSVDFSVNDGQPVHLRITGGESVDLSIGAESYTVITPEYDGEWHFTPCTHEIIAPTNGYKMTHDFVVDPIPSNYGLITYDGSVITVS